MQRAHRIRDSILPFARPADRRDVNKERALSYFEENPKGGVAALAELLGISKRSAERVVVELKAMARSYVRAALGLAFGS